MNINRNIYIDIDTLFDTRYGTLKQFDNKLAADVATSDYYKDRITDEFSHVGMNHFKELYNKRELSTLKSSFITKIIEPLSMEIDLLANKRLSSGEALIITIEVNTFRYDLDELTTKRIAAGMREYMFNNSVNIIFIDVDPVKLDFEYINSSYEVMFMYDMLWLDYMVGVSKTTAPSTVLYLPSLLLTAITLKDYKEIEKLLDRTCELYSLYIKLVFIPVEFYNITNLAKSKLKGMK